MARHPFRKLVVLLDADMVAGVESTGWSREWLLACLLTLEFIECVRYSDIGPPVDAPRHHENLVGEWVIGWAVVGPEDKAFGHRPLRWSFNNTSVTDGAITGNGADVAAADIQIDAYGELEPDAAADRRRADAVAVMAAEAIGADLFITNRPYLYQVTWSLAAGVTCCRLEDALAALGLYQRVQGSFVISGTLDGRGKHTMNRGLYFWVGTRELLPSAWRWFAACAQHSAGGGDESLLLLGQSTLQRVQRALQVRDEVHVELNKPQNNDTADKALSSLDVVLLLLMGAVDATARVAHAVLGIDGAANGAGWQHASWLAKVCAKATAAGQLFQAQSDHSHTLTILRQLRNSIHGEALSALGVSQSRRRDRTLVGLRVANEGQLLGAFAALGGESAWGVEKLIPGSRHADPGMLLEQMLPRVLHMLNEIMDATPVEQLPHVNLRQSDLQPPVAPGPLPGSFDELNRQSIRWQLGL